MDFYQNTNAYQNNVNVNVNVNDNVNERWYFHFVEVPTIVGLRPYSFENNKNICYNNNIKKEVSFIKPISKIEEENPFIFGYELEL